MKLEKVIGFNEPSRLRRRRLGRNTVGEGLRTEWSQACCCKGKARRAVVLGRGAEERASKGQTQRAREQNRKTDKIMKGQVLKAAQMCRWEPLPFPNTFEIKFLGLMMSLGKSKFLQQLSTMLQRMI